MKAVGVVRAEIVRYTHETRAVVSIESLTEYCDRERLSRTKT